MDPWIDTWVAGVNEIGRRFCGYAGGAFVQSAVLIVVLLAVDLVLRRCVRATLRHWIWMLVFVKLLLPPTLSLPTGIGYWIGGYVAPQASIAPAVAPAPVPHMSRAEATPPEVVGRAARPAPTTRSIDVPVATAESVESVVPGGHLAWQGGIFLLWCAGVLVLTGLTAQRLVFVRKLVGEAEAVDENLRGLLNECRRCVGIRVKVKVRLSPRSFNPAVCGLWRPTILMPAVLRADLSRGKLRTVLLHELAHVRRADLWVNCLQTALQVVYFYHPLVWLANAIVRRIREQAVDEMVLVALGAEAGSYSRTLVDIAEIAFLRANPALRLVGVAESKNALEGRIRHMISRPIPRSANVGVWGLSGILLVAVVLLPMARAQNRAPQDTKSGGLNGSFNVLVLDDADLEYEGKEQYEDRLYLLDDKGIEGAVTGLNICQTIGGWHTMAVDEERKTLSVVENVGDRLWHFDVTTGKLLQKVPVPGLARRPSIRAPGTSGVWSRRERFGRYGPTLCGRGLGARGCLGGLLRHDLAIHDKRCQAAFRTRSLGIFRGVQRSARQGGLRGRIALLARSDDPRLRQRAIQLSAVQSRIPECP